MTAWRRRWDVSTARQMLLAGLLAHGTVACTDPHLVYVGSDVLPSEQPPPQSSFADREPPPEDRGQTIEVPAPVELPSAVPPVPSAPMDAMDATVVPLPSEDDDDGSEDDLLAQDASMPSGTLDCASGFEDCDGDPSNGCEANLLNSVTDCGTCGVKCDPADLPFGARSAACVAGACVLQCTLPNNLGNCDDDPSNGCETDLYHDAANCGMCGKRCNGCFDGRCL